MKKTCFSPKTISSVQLRFLLTTYSKS